MAHLLIILAILFTGATAGTVFAGFDEGVSAFKRKDHAVALEEFRAAAKNGDAEAQYYLGRMYLMADGVPSDYKQAADFFRKAAAHGNANAQFYLGVLNYLGEGVPQDYSKAVKWYSRAAAQGDHVAQYSLGVMYASGAGVTTDHVQALMWFDLAAAGGSEAAEKFRKIMTRKMTAAEISKAKRLSRERMSTPRQLKPDR
jgi:TPR repeat protein